jgi:TolB-like protein
VTDFFTELKRRNVFRVGFAYVVIAWLIAQVADLVFDNIEAPEWLMPALLFLLAVGFALALFFAWAFELTPEGIKKEKDVDRSQSITHKTGRKLDFTIIGILVLALGYFIWESRFEEKGSGSLSDPMVAQEVGAKTPESEPDPISSIAVLPFVNMSADADNEYFSDGISEELLNVMVRVNSLRVASRTSAFAYKGKDVAVKQIAEELDVDHILEGSVRKAGNTVRITAQLIDANTDRHLWSETYERELDDIFDIQEEISNAIVDALKIALNVDEVQALERVQHPTENAEAYALYLQGRHLWRTRQEANIREGIRLFKQAIELDPGYAKAYEALAVATLVLPAWSNEVRADALVAEAHAVLAEIYSENHQWAQMMSAYEAAVRHEPKNPTAHQWYAENLNNAGFLDKALEEIKIAYALDPASPVINGVSTLLWSTAGEDKLARRHLEIALSLGIRERGGNLDATYIRERDWQALRRTMRFETPVPDYADSCVDTFIDPAKQEMLLEELYAASPLEWRGYYDVLCAGVAGDIKLALDVAIASVRTNWTRLKIFWDSTSIAKQMRRTDTFKELLTEIGLVDFYREYGWPDRCRPLSEEDFECD